MRNTPPPVALDRWRAALAPHRKSCWIPKTAPGDPDPTASKYFGDPWLPEGTDWPASEGVPLAFVLQLDVASLPAPISGALGGEGLVQLFYDKGNNVRLEQWDQAKLSLARLVRPELTAGAPSRCPYRIGQAISIVGWDERDDFPRQHDHAALNLESLQVAIAEKVGIYVDDLDEGCLQGDKLGGWPFWVEGDMGSAPRIAGEAMIPFYQVDAGTFFDGPSVPAHAPRLFGGGGMGHLFFLPSDPGKLAFRWECT